MTGVQTCALPIYQPEYATQLQQMQQLLKAEMQRLNDPALLEF